MKHRRLDDVVSPSASMPDVVAPTTTTHTTTTTTTTTANQHTYPEKGNLKIFHLTKEIVGLVLEANPIFVSLPRSMIQSVLHSVLVYCLSHPCPLGVNGGPDGAVSAPLLREPTFIEMDQRLHHLSSHPGKIKVKRFQRIVLPLPSCSSRDVKASLGGVGGQVDRVGAPHSTSSNPTAASIIPQNYPQMTMPTTTTNNNNMMMSMVIVPTTTTDYPVWYSSHTLLPPQPSYLPHAAATTVLYGNSSSVPPLSTVVIPQPQPQPRPPFSALPSSVVCPSLAAPMMTMGSRREPAAVERERGVLYPAGRVCWEIEGYGRLTCPRLVEAIVTMNKTHDSRSLRVGDMGRLHVWWWWYVRNASPPSFFSS